ncbi:MAG: hypothetical protein ACD_80C00147G0007 [uncultured bacterium (gcode 4)]|uniref:Uncharacterized protein n=1 Tax=uncultured bacterium (gcode 4) TaxID=1234023 RepID=K1XWN2_9BACT|nr:MAG: hypothetical protein ACD_80C00147G0007 [uncultured bacterium (gcode 4)]
MAARKSLLKVFVIIILAVFLLSTGLISVLYLGGATNTPWTGDISSWDAIPTVLSWDIRVPVDTTIQTWTDLTGTDLSWAIK